MLLALKRLGGVLATFLATFLAAIMGLIAPAIAQSWPEKPVRRVSHVQRSIRPTQFA